MPSCAAALSRQCGPSLSSLRKSVSVLQAAVDDPEAFADTAVKLLTSKAEMLQECIGLGIDKAGDRRKAVLTQHHIQSRVTDTMLAEHGLAAP